jgi:hypothetical protein
VQLCLCRGISQPGTELYMELPAGRWLYMTFGVVLSIELACVAGTRCRGGGNPSSKQKYLLHNSIFPAQQHLSSESRSCRHVLINMARNQFL